MLASHFFISLLATLVLIKSLCPIAVKIGLTDHPCHRKQHKVPTPLIGGLAIYLGIGVTLLLSEVHFPNQMAYLIASALLVGVGLVDDYKGLGVKIRIVAQIVAALIMTEMADIKIVSLGNLLFTGDIALGSLATPFTIFAVVGGINAFNMIDGLDGLAGTLALVSMAALALVSWFAQDMLLLDFCIIVMAAIMAFLAFNLRVMGRTSAGVFLGDTGSTLLGFTVCWLAIGASQSESPLLAPVTVLWIIAIPLFDSVCIMIRRLGRRRSPFQPDREHLHHIMSLTGYSVNEVVAHLVSYGLVMAIIGIVADLFFNIPNGMILLFFLVLFISHYWGMDHAWIFLKIRRYLLTRRQNPKQIVSRRAWQRRVNSNAVVDIEQRSMDRRQIIKGRRFVPTELQLDKFYRCEEDMDNPAYRKKLKNKIKVFWFNFYVDRKS
ncbi:MAG: undecaprenyl-phosphate alpha-N-acetylglucosaminyl 1-phosphate transferase [Methylococcaceae bacterium]|nr:undecaprenyl-phosphate alpha-N-acetylglucosaminyl 1-phosphate transferase [Methylococcaceae bacterium]